MTTLSPPPQLPGEQIRLLNAIVDVCLVYGFDETCQCDLVIGEGDSEDISLPMEKIYQRDINVRFLQVIAPGRVYPERHCTTTVKAFEVKGSVEDSLIMPSSTHSNKQFNVDELGLSWDTIENRQAFLFPQGAKICSDLKDVEPSLVPMLFTNALGDFSYGVGIRFLRPFFIEKKKNCKYFCLTPWSSSVVPSPSSKLIYLPTCCLLVSQKPYLKFMKDALSGFYRWLSDCDELYFWSGVREFAERVFLVPAPPPGLLSISVSLPGFSSQITVRPPRGSVETDIRLNHPFTCLGVANVLRVICAILTEQSILFVSSSYYLPTYVIKCLFSYITPMQYKFTVAPILPADSLELLDAPFPTIMGILSSQMNTEEVQRCSNVVIVDVDNGEVTCKDLETTLASLPRHAEETFKKRYSELVKKTFSLEEMEKLTLASSEETLREREKFDYSYDELLSKMFLELMVNLYSQVTQERLHSRIKFEETVRLMPEEDQDFYHQIETTDMFASFCHARRQCTARDEFTLLAERLKRLQRVTKIASEDSFTSSLQISHRSSIVNLYGASSSLRTTANTSHGSLPQNRYLTSPSSYRSHAPSQVGGSISVNEEGPLRYSPQGEYNRSGSIVSLEPVLLELPSLGSKFTDRATFLEEAITLLEELAKNNAVKAQCLYLGAYYSICQGEIISGLDILFDTLQRVDVNLVPDKKSLQVVLKYVSNVEQGQLSLKSYYKHLLPSKRKSASVRGPSGLSPSTFNLDKKMPTKPLNLNDFLKLVRQNAIAEDAESATNLHRILSQGINTTISPDTFRVFYDSWKVVHQDNSVIELPLMELEKEEKGVRVAETVLAVSQDEKTNYGSSCTIVLTTYRLLVVAAFKTYEMADLRTQIRFENFSHSTMFGGTKFPGIRIEKLDKRSSGDRARPTTGGSTGWRKPTKHMDLYMAFRSSVERDNWYHMIREVQVGWQLSQARRDPCVMVTSNSHVILQNAISQSGLLDNHTPAQRVKLALKLLSFQSKDVSEVSKFTVDNLQYRINPCLHEAERQTVESLLYIPPIDFYEEEQGKLWIGLGNGRLKVYDIEAKCFECDIKITESRHGKSARLNCLLLVGQQVWVGSHSRNIHILDVQTVTHVSQISYLEDAPKDLMLNRNGSLVWGLLLNGILLAWDPETRTRVKKIQVPIVSTSSAYTACTCFTIWRDYIWVGTNRGSITIMDTETGEVDHELFFPGGRRRQIEIKHLALSSEDEVWCSVYCLPKSEDSIFIAVFDPDTKKKNLQYTALDSRISIILPVKNTMWCGSKSGKIYIFHSQSYASGAGMPKILTAHDEDVVRSMTMTDLNLVVSGGGSNDGYAAVWKTIELP
ncbi:DENN domain-containing protein 3-like [Halichondria panicea]|uniref:DENN domain-containing protein 3-like n=1 Tax=Halichondria panicea TaxID=6063 RepID=UPI00312B98F7